MKKKIIKILVGILIVAILILGALCIIDHIRMSNNEPVIFSTWGKKYTAPETKKSDKIVALYKTIIDDIVESQNGIYSNDKYISLDVKSLKAPSLEKTAEYSSLTEEEQNELLEYCEKYNKEVKNLSMEELKEQGFNKGDDTFIELEGALLGVLEIEQLTENKAVITFQSFHTGLGAVMPKYELKYKNGKWDITVREIAVS